MRSSVEDFEFQFTEAMRPIGGIPAKEFFSDCSTGPNADLIFPKIPFFLEIKTLTKDPRSKKQFQKALFDKYMEWAKAGRVPYRKPPFSVTSRELPNDCAVELANWITNGVHGHAKKANQQIRSLKTRLGMNEAKGTFLLCNTGNTFLSPHVVLNRLYHTFRTQKSSIDWVIYMTFGCPVMLKEVGYATEIFAQPNRPGYDPMPSELFHEIKNAWMEYQAKKSPVTQISGLPQEVLFDAVNIDH